ncbi:MAG: IS200/IS605 family transposase [Paramuribaculum sp.]|nr:IS200/IS605 family transposase [Paramuribaculum sp.]
MSRVSALYHIVFATKRRESTITKSNCEALYRYIWSVITNSGSVLYRIGGIENHIHILLDLNPSLALSTQVRDIKSRSSSWMKQSGLFLKFNGWASEYFAASVAYADRDKVINYIKSQPQHHSVTQFEDELRFLITQNGRSYPPGFLI